MIEQLERRWAEMREFEQSTLNEWREYHQALDALSRLSGDEIRELVGAAESPGALPTLEVDPTDGLRVRFIEKFHHHEDARGWAAQVLANNPIVAVDGSQIPPSADLPLPVAAVQAAWFENHHTTEGRYERQIEFELLTPGDLRPADGDEDDPYHSSETINLRRFELELQTLRGRLRYLAGMRDEVRLPIGLLDGPLVISFADRLPENWRNRYVAAALGLLRESEESGIPIVGYVDGSRSRDLVNLLALAYGLPTARRISDASLLAGQLAWGERTPLLICARGSADRRQPGILDSLEEYRRAIGFVYLRTGHSAPLARLEIPLWVLERGLLHRVIDLVRAEVIVGNGYPYAIQSADAAAALSGQDREQFESIVCRFAARQGVESPKTSKAISKLRRR